MRRTPKQAPLLLAWRLRCSRRYRRSWMGSSGLRLVSLTGTLAVLAGNTNVATGRQVSASPSTATTPSTCGRQFLIDSDSSKLAPGDGSDDGAAVVAAGLLLSRGRGFMGAAMVDNPAMVLFAGGIGRQGTVVDANVDAYAFAAMPPGGASDSTTATDGGGGIGDVRVERYVLALEVARTDMGAVATASALFFAGGCGMDISPPPPSAPAAAGRQAETGGVGKEEEEEGHEASGPEIVQDGAAGAGAPAGGAAAAGDPDFIPLLLKNCQATDAVDVFSLAGAGAAQAEEEGRRKKGLSLVATNGVRLCEPKYAAAVGVFFTGTADNGDPYSWSPTAQVLVAGGIVPSGGGSQYMATDTVDIFREDGLDDVTGEAEIAKLSAPRLPNPPRFEMTSCCFKHQCVFAGGRVSMGQGGVGFNSDRVDVWDGATWSFATWGEHTLSEPRHHMGSAVIEIYTGSATRTVGIFAGGVENTGDSPVVDMFDFHEMRVLPRMYAPTIRGPAQGVSLAREVAAFFGETGKIDVFDGRTLCWMSYEAEDFLPGTSVVGKSAAWFFNSASPGFQPSGLSDGGSSAEEASVFVGGGVGSSSGTAGEKDVSRNVRELRWRRGEGGDTHACLGGKPLRQLQKVCGLPGPDGSIQAFTPHDQEGEMLPGGDRVAAGAGKRAPGSQGHTGRVLVFIMAALGGIFVSYMASATLIVRKVEGLWRLPFGGGVYEALCEGVAQCWRGSWRRLDCSPCFGADESPEGTKRNTSSDRNNFGYTTGTAGEGARLIIPPGKGDVEESRRSRRGQIGGGGSGCDSIGNSSCKSARTSAASRRTTALFNIGEEGSSRPRARSDSSNSGGGGSGGGRGEYWRNNTAEFASSGSNGGGGGGGGSSSNGRKSNTYGSAGSGRGGGIGEWGVAARKKRGGGVQILASSAVDAAVAAAELAAEVANDSSGGDR